MKIFKDNRVTMTWSSNNKTPRIFWSDSVEKHQISNAHNFENTGPI